jgi:hypothetical protein
MRSPLLFLAASLALGAMTAGAQVDAADTLEYQDDYLLYITQKWGRESPLGDLRRRAMRADDIELRVWGGYGLGGTSGVIIRRENGQWRAWRAAVGHCAKWVPVAVYKTGSTRAIEAHLASTNQGCDEKPPQSPPVVKYFIQRLIVTDIATSPAIEQAWKVAVENDVATLPPPQLPPETVQADGFTYLLELRRGNDYRTSMTPSGRLHEPEEVERRTRNIYLAVRALLPRGE